MCSSCNNVANSIKHTIVWLDYDNSLLYRDNNVKDGEIPVYRGEIPSRGEGFVFDGWTPDITPAYYDTTYTAKYTSSSYTVRWVNDDNSLLKSEVYRYGEMPLYNDTPSSSAVAPTGYAYVFNGWKPETRPVTQDITYTAQYKETKTHYKITLETYGGVLSKYIYYFNYGDKYSLPTPERNGYIFSGWYDSSRKLIPNSGHWGYKMDMTIYAYYNAIEYKIDYVLDGGTNNKSNPTSYYSYEDITLLDPTKENYNFVGWFDKNNNRITTISKGTYGDLTLYARWTPAQYNLSIYSENESKGVVSIISGSGYYNEEITVKATPLGDCIFKGWYHDLTRVSTDEIYTFVMPSGDYSLSARFYTQDDQIEENKLISLGIVPNYDSEAKTMTYGLYPQSLIKDNDLISTLDTIQTPTSNGWYLYNDAYYVKSQSIKSGKFVDGSTFNTNDSYWFKCEPIKWKVCKTTVSTYTETTSYFLLSDVVLDAQKFYKDRNSRTIDGVTIYSNNYEYSDIRPWLNNEFYNTAFSLNNEYIADTYCQNYKFLVNSWSYEIAQKVAEVRCKDTKDKVFLMSSYECYNLLGAEVRRMCKPSDYSLIKGANSYSDNVEYMTRSPFVRSIQVSYTHIDGVAESGEFVLFNPDELTGIRPCITLSLNVL